jgi:regulator of Ty1 transposition protein 109
MATVDLAAAGPSTSRQSQQSLLHHVKESLAHSAALRSCRGKIRLHILFSTPRPAKDLYPFAHVDTGDAGNLHLAQPVEAYVEHIIMTASYTGEGQEQGRLMYALECFLYTLPKHKSSLLYVSKLDSSGWGPTTVPKHLQALLLESPGQEDALWDSSSSITRVITKAFLSYFASLSHWSNDTRLPAVGHISIHILARAQGAYLFPNSNDNKGKHILSDGALIKWWRSVMSSVVCGVRRRGRSIDARPFYIIPGYDRLESHELLPLPPPRPSQYEPKDRMPADGQALAEAGWVYGHPYSPAGASIDANLPPLPLSGPSFATSNNPDFDSRRIAMLLPYFPDDPKSRFIVEIARDSYEFAALPKRKAEENEENGHEPKKAKVISEGGGGQAEKADPSVVTSTSVGLVELKARRETRALDAVTPDEFWQRMGFRQECCAGNAVGVFACLFTRAEDGNGNKADKESSEGMCSQSLALHDPLIPDLIRKHLMRDACDWSLQEESKELTKAWDEGVERAARRKGGMDHAKGSVEQGEVGRDVIVVDVILRGPTAEEIASAEEKWKSTAVPPSNGTPVTQVNTLSVKRKKKV